MKVFFNAIVIHLIFNLYVFIRGWQILPPKKTFRIPYSILFIAELIIYFIGFFVNVKIPISILKPILFTGTSWMVLIGYISAFLLIYDLIKWSGKKIACVKKLHLEAFGRKRFFFISVWCVVLSIMAYGNYKFRHPVVNEYNLHINKEVEGIDQLRLVMVSDIHVGYLIDKKILSRYVDKIMEQKPDLILIVGDIIDYDLYPLIEERMEEELSRLQAPYGVYASTGNHEYRLNAEEKITWLNENGLTVLRDDFTEIDDKIYLIGREDDKYPNKKPLSEILANVNREQPVIVMNHQPQSLQQESEQKVDLALYGHTHNGQLFPYNIFMDWIYEVAHGYKKKDDTHIYVSSGLGLAGPQYRIGTISEIVVLNLSFN